MNYNIKENTTPVLADYARTDILVYDDFLPLSEQENIFGFLRAPGWGFGAFSDSSPTASRYWYKHFAGYLRDGSETLSPLQIEAELATTAPLLAAMWTRLKASVIEGHSLARCYANGYPTGSEGGLHRDSNIPTHYTLIYYPFFAWHPNFGGETVFFNRDGSDIIAAIYPRPNRVVMFPGVIPHVARGLSRGCQELRITLMFKTTGP